MGLWPKKQVAAAPAADSAAAVADQGTAAAERRSPDLEQQPRVELPAAGQDHPKLARVGVMSLGGFVVGVLLPWLVGSQLVPSPPAEEIGTEETPAASSGSPKVKEQAPSEAAKAPEEGPAPEDRVEIGKLIVTSCEDASGRKQSSCDDIDFDSVALSRLRALATCGDQEVPRGVLSAGFDLDFGKGEITRFRNGKSTTYRGDSLERLLGCVKKEFENVELGGIKHEHATYTVFYKVELNAEQKKEGVSDVTPAKGTATVAWGTALIRKQPGSDHPVIARLLSGTKVVVTGRKGDWYRIEYGANSSEGWVWHDAIGL